VRRHPIARHLLTMSRPMASITCMETTKTPHFLAIDLGAESGRAILVSLRDSGSDKTPLGVPVIPGPLEERGRGFALMNKLMDYVKVKSYPNGGTRVSMLRRLDRDP
jgi:hypothetical protein